MNETATAPIVYFDGWCGLCNRFVDFLLRIDRHRRLRFATLQGDTAAERLPRTFTGTPTTIVVEHEGRLTERSNAALLCLQLLGGAWRLVALLRVIPRPLRDGMYDWIARNRFHWYGRRGTCRIPTADEKTAFLP